MLHAAVGSFQEEEGGEGLAPSKQASKHLKEEIISKSVYSLEKKKKKEKKSSSAVSAIAAILLLC